MTRLYAVLFCSLLLFVPQSAQAQTAAQTTQRFPDWLQNELKQPPVPGRVEKLIGPCRSGVCKIKDVKGGVVREFIIAATDIARRSDIERVEIEGLCASSCVFLADVVRKKVCLRKAAKFGFHLYRTDMKRVPEAEKHLYADRKPYVPPHAKDILDIVAKHGTLTVKPLTISGKEFSTIWPQCP